MTEQGPPKTHPATKTMRKLAKSHPHQLFQNFQINQRRPTIWRTFVKKKKKADVGYLTCTIPTPFPSSQQPWPRTAMAPGKISSKNIHYRQAEVDRRDKKKKPCSNQTLATRDPLQIQRQNGPNVQRQKEARAKVTKGRAAMTTRISDKINLLTDIVTRHGEWRF